MPVGSEWWGADATEQLTVKCNDKSRQCLSAVSGGVPSIAFTSKGSKTLTLSPMPVGSEWWGASNGIYERKLESKDMVANACRQ